MQVNLLAICADETLVGFTMFTHEPFQGEWRLTQTPYQEALGIVRLMRELLFSEKKVLPSEGVYVGKQPEPVSIHFLCQVNQR